jgi:hypothetical protein
MGILQEYKYLLIIFILWFIWIMSFYYSSFSHQQFHNYNSNLKTDYIYLKKVYQDNTNLYDVLNRNTVIEDEW